MAESFSRRSFLAALAAGLVMDPERLLWRKGAKHYSIPKPTPGIRERDWISLHETWVRNAGQVLYYRNGELIQMWPVAEAPIVFLPFGSWPPVEWVEAGDGARLDVGVLEPASPAELVAVRSPLTASGASRNPPLRRDRWVASAFLSPVEDAPRRP